MNDHVITETVFDEAKIRKNESLMCRGNGYICMRGSLEESYAGEKRGTFINGIFDAAENEVTELAVMPDTTRFDIYADGERVQMSDRTVYTRKLNTSTGEYERVFSYRTHRGITVCFKIRAFVSAADKHLAAWRMEARTERGNVRLRIVTGIDASVTNSGVQHLGVPERRVYRDGVMGLYTRTLHSGVDIAVAAAVCGGNISYTADRRSVTADISEIIGENGAVIEKFTAYHTSRDIEYADGDTDIRNSCTDLVRIAAGSGYERLFEESSAVRNEWAKLHNDTIYSDNEIFENALRFAEYHLDIMTSKDDSRVGIGAKGMSGEGYKGHSYWDTEIFILPYFIFTEPQTARRLLEYRYMLLKGAIDKAKKYGYEGAMYPWEAAWITDGETCPEYGDLDLLTGEVRRNLMGEIEVHISADIAYAVWQYYIVTGDREFMEKMGAEIILLTAMFWCSRVTEDGSILDVIGPDEYKDRVDNNAYTNYMAYHNLKLVSSVIQFVSEELYRKYDIKKIAERAERTAGLLYLPEPDENGIIQQFDGYGSLENIDISKYKDKGKAGLIFKEFGFSDIQRMKVSKQADTIMLFYLFPKLFDKEVQKKNYIYYEERTLHDSSLSMCIHALCAARLSIAETAERMYESACSVDIGDTDNSDDGIHSASIGGIWLALVFGFGGLRADESGLSLSPVLPPGWRGYRFTVTYRGRRIEASIDSNGCILKRLSGDKLTLRLKGRITEI